jgi:hypothetical protein
MRAFRMDDRKQRLIVDGGLTDGERFFGWEVADATALDALAARLENAGVAVKRETTAVADQRCVAEDPCPLLGVKRTWSRSHRMSFSMLV